MTTRTRLAAVMVAVAVAIALIPIVLLSRPTFFERHRGEAEAYCRIEPEKKFRKHPLADGSDPAPHFDAFQWCVGAYISHLPQTDQLAVGSSIGREGGRLEPAPRPPSPRNQASMSV